MALRKVPGALALGLLASLIAHFGLFGGSHAMGGDYHDLLLQGALGGSVGLLLFFGGLAWSGARGCADGSILAARLSERLPGFGSVLLTCGLWYGIAEFVEPHHAAALPIAVLAILAACAWLVARAASDLVALLARIVIAVAAPTATSLTASWTARPHWRRAARRVARTRRRFARPPPIAIACRA